MEGIRMDGGRVRQRERAAGTGRANRSVGWIVGRACDDGGSSPESKVSEEKWLVGDFRAPFRKAGGATVVNARCNLRFARRRVAQEMMIEDGELELYKLHQLTTTRTTRTGHCRWSSCPIHPVPRLNWQQLRQLAMPGIHQRTSAADGQRDSSAAAPIIALSTQKVRGSGVEVAVMRGAVAARMPCRGNRFPSAPWVFRMIN